MVRNIRRMNLVTILILSLNTFWMFKSIIATNPIIKPSMDVGNIISIVIPESPDVNVNIDQLTLDFRRQLERIRKQSRVNKLESGLVTLKNVLPEMLREAKKKPSPLLHRPSSHSKNSNQLLHIFPKNTNSRIIQMRNNLHHSRRNSPNWINLRKYYQQYHDIVSATKRSVWPIKHANKLNRKNLKFYSNELNHWNNMNNNRMNNNNNNNNNENWNKLTRKLRHMEYPESFNCDNKNGRPCINKFSNEMNEHNDQSLLSIPSARHQVSHKFLSQSNNNNNDNNDNNDNDHDINNLQQSQQEKIMIGDNNLNNLNLMKKNVTANDCASIILMDIDGQVYSICNNTRLINIPEVTEDDVDFGSVNNDNDTLVPNNLRDDDKIVLPVNIEVDDLKSVERIIANPQEALDQMNSSGFNIDNFRMSMNGNMLKRSSAIESNDNLENAAILTSINHDTNEFQIDDDVNGENKNIFEYSVKNRDLTHDNYKINNNNNKRMELMSDGVGYKHHMRQNIPKVTHELNFDNENFEIRIQRSIDDNFQLKKSINAQLQELLLDNENIELKPITDK